MNNIRIKDIAKKAGVSVGTVDRVLHNRGEVALVTRKKVMQIVEELGYQPNLLARTLASKKEYVIAVIIPKSNEKNPFWEKPLEGILKAEESLAIYNLRVEKFFYEQYEEQQFIDQTTKVVELNPEGVIFAPVFTNESLAFINKLDRAKIPFVLFNSDLDTDSKVCFIGQDSYQSGYLAASLMYFGLRNEGDILIVNIIKDLENFNHFVERTHGFNSYFEEITNNNTNLFSLKVEDVNDKILDHFFEKHKNIKGVYVSGSKVFHLAKYFEKKGTNEMILIGYDLIRENINYLENGFISFLISQKSEEQAYQGITKLFNHVVKKASIPKKEMMPIDIITKENLKYYR